MIFTLDVDLKPNTHKMLPYCATIYKVEEKLQKEKHYTEEDWTEHRKDKG